jgi:phage tail sheath protein FI
MAIGPAPGVYREDLFPPLVPSLAVGVPVFLGLAGQGDVNVPQRLTLWAQFETAFGTPAGFLGSAVRGFFENDGLLCYALRLDDTATPVAGLRSGLAAAADLDVDLVCAPDLVGTADPDAVPDLQAEVLSHCENAGDRLAILDGVLAGDRKVIEDQRNALLDATAVLGCSSKDGALYHPWLWVTGLDGQQRHVPPCGHVAGAYSRSDQRVGVHKAPANEPIEGVLDLRVNHTAADVGALFTLGVNCLQAQPGRGIRVWGARTLSAEVAWQQVSARRVFHTLSRWIERFLTDLVYEPNDVRLWVRIMRELTVFLDGLHASGALRGRTPDEAFFVKCDNETNPPEVIAAGRVVTLVGLALAAPAEFVVARIIHGTSGVTIATTGA